MTTPSPAQGASSEQQSLAWVGPFAVFIAWMAVDKYLPIANPAKEITRDLTMVAAIMLFSARILPRSAPHWIGSIGVGLGVCALWVAPDLLFPGWRGHWMFQNVVTGRLSESIAPVELTPVMLVLRTARAALIVPVVEELFWRGWLPRWMQNSAFYRVPLGQYTAFAFWGTALLFAAEHGPFWEVGLLCGVVYNLWLRHTRSMGDLILTHAVTNLALSLYVIWAKDWRFWM